MARRRRGEEEGGGVGGDGEDFLRKIFSPTYNFPPGKIDLYTQVGGKEGALFVDKNIV